MSKTIGTIYEGTAGKSKVDEKVIVQVYEGTITKESANLLREIDKKRKQNEAKQVIKRMGTAYERAKANDNGEPLSERLSAEFKKIEINEQIATMMETSVEEKKARGENLTPNDYYRLNEAKKLRGEEGSNRPFVTPQNTSQAFLNWQSHQNSFTKELEIGIKNSKDFWQYYNKGKNIDEIEVKDKGVYNKIKNSTGIYEYMSASEKETYYYLLGRGDNAEIQKYLRRIKPELESRKAVEIANDESVLNDFGAAIASGIMGSLLNMGRGMVNGSYIAGNFQNNEMLAYSLEPSYVEKLFQEVKNNSTDKSYIYNLLLDAANSISAQIPQLALGAVGGYGTYVLSMAAQSIGSSTTEAINQGYDGVRGVMYGLVDTATELLTERILGGVGAKISGSSINPLLKKALGAVDDVFADKRVANLFAKTITAVFSSDAEGVEEFTQRLLEPIIRNIIYGENNKITEKTFYEAVRSYLIGTISGFAIDTIYTGTSKKLLQTRIEILGDELKNNLGIEKILKFAEAIENKSEIYYEIKGNFDAGRDVDNALLAQLYQESVNKFENPSSDILKTIAAKNVDTLIKVATDYTTSKHKNAENLVLQSSANGENVQLAGVNGSNSGANDTSVGVSGNNLGTNGQISGTNGQISGTAPQNTETIAAKNNNTATDGVIDESQIIDLSNDNELAQLLGDMTGSPKYKKIRDYIFSLLGGHNITLSDGKNAIVDKSDALHIAHGSGTQKTAQISKIKEIIEKAQLYAEDNNVEHDKFDYFCYYRAFVRVGKDVVPVYLNVGKGKTDSKYHIYDITKKIRDTAHRVNDVGRPVGNALENGVSIDIIDGKPPIVNSSISDSGENYSENAPKRHHTTKAEQDLIKRICQALGIKMKFVHITSKLMAEYGYTFEDGALPDGFYNKEDGTLYIGYTVVDPVKFVFKHELTHFGEGTAQYKKFVEAVDKSKAFKEWLAERYGEKAGTYSPAALEGKVRQQYIDARKAFQPDFGPEDAKAEMVADFVGDCLFNNDTAALERMVSDLDYKERNAVIQYILDFLSHIKRKLAGEQNLVFEITRLENQFNHMLSEAVQTKKATNEGGGLKFSKAEDTSLYKYIKDALAGVLPKKSFFKISERISDRLATDIEKIVGFSVKGYGNEISPSNIQHIENEHGAKGRKDTSMKDHRDLARIAYVIDNYEKISEGKISSEYKNSDGTKAKTVVLQKRIDGEFYYVVEAVPDANLKTLHIVSAYKNKKDTFSDVPVSNDPRRYVQDEHQPNVSNNSIDGNLPTVKNNISDSGTNNSENKLEFTFSRALDKEKIAEAERLEKELEGAYDGNEMFQKMEIWGKTGLTRDPSGVWVYEIDDSKMRFFALGDRFKKRKTPHGRNLLKNYIRHKELFERYPQLEKTELAVYDSGVPGERGGFSREDNCIVLDKTFLETATRKEVVEVIVHEIQHAAQYFDERENGASIEYWNQRLKLGTMPKNPKTGREYTPYEAYRATRGEFEARMSQKRLFGMEPEVKEMRLGMPFYKPENTISADLDLVGVKEQENTENRPSLKFSIPTDHEYTKAVESGDTQALQQMVDNKAKASGYTERLYHQTGAEFTEFNTDNQKAGKYDWELPTGMFLKPSDNDIGLKGKKQMDLYAKQQNPLEFKDRAEAQRYWRDNVEGYADAADKIIGIDTEYQNKLEVAAQNTRNYLKKWRQNNPGVDSREIYSDAEYQRLNDSEDSIVDEWEAKSDEASLEAKQLIDNYIAESDYDGVVLLNDAGAMGRQTKTYIVFDSAQLKDASPITYDDSGNVIPLSDRFDGDKKDIRFSMPNALSPEEMLEAYENGEISRQDYLNALRNDKTLNPVEISDLTKEAANTTPKLKRKTGVSDGDKESKFYDSVMESKLFDLSFKAEVADDTFVRKYKSVTNKETLQKAADELDIGGLAYVNKWWTIDPAHASLMDTAVGLILMDRYQRIGDYDSAAAVTEKVREFGTAGGQQIQIFSILGRLSPETMALYAQRELDKAFKIFVKDKTQKWINQNQDKFKLTKEDIDFIREHTVLAALFEENTRQKAVLLGEVAARVQDKIPPQKGDSIRAFQRNAMLLNLKTNIRNVTGNGGMVPVFIASDIVGSGIDKLVAKKTGIRTTGNFDVKSVAGIKKGLYESYDDFKLGIRTKQEELNRFDVNTRHSGKSFNDDSTGLFGTGALKKQLDTIARGLNKIDNFTSFCLEAGDRPFFEMWYMNSLNTQMKLNKMDIPTSEMMEIARQEALQRTWQDDNTFTKSVSRLKRILNDLVHLPNSNYGLGDFVLKFVKTPSNLAKAIIEFSPAGLVGAVSNAKKLNNAIETNRFTPQMQKEYVRSLSNAITGTLLYTLVGVGAALGLVKLSGDGDDDKDVSNFEKYIMGIPPYSIEFFGISITYDWMQPFGAILATVAEFMETRETNSEMATGDVIWEAICAGGKTFTQQSFLQSMYEFFSGDDVIDGLVNIALAEPAAFIPQALSQAASFSDKYRRTTYNANSKFQTAINKVMVKIPGLRTKLPKQVNSLGEDTQNTQYLNLWEAFASPWNTYPKSSKEVVGEIHKLYKDSGEASVMPRMAPNYFEKGGVRINFTPDEKADFQRAMGDRSVQMLTQLFNLREYSNLTDQQKVKIVGKIYSYSFARAKSELEYDFETLSAILGEDKNGQPILTEEKYNRMSARNKKLLVEELFLSNTEIKYLDNYKKLVDYYIRKAKD